MNKTTRKRTYNMSKRAETSAQTAKDIFNATKTLWHEHPLADITLDAIAELANVSVRTIIRRYGSKEELFEACIQNNVSDIELYRDKATVGNIEEAIHYLLQDYETHGDAMIRTLAAEDQLDIAQRTLKAGRDYHRQWCEKIFAPYLPEKSCDSYHQKLLAFVAATELYLWKLLRRDLKQDLDTTKKTLLQLVQGLIPPEN